jgi:hypothetical protein
MNEQIMSNFVDRDYHNDTDTQQPTLWMDAFPNNDNYNEDTQQPNLWLDAFNNNGKDNPCN